MLFFCQLIKRGEANTIHYWQLTVVLLLIVLGVRWMDLPRGGILAGRAFRRSVSVEGGGRRATGHDGRHVLRVWEVIIDQQHNALGDSVNSPTSLNPIGIYTKSSRTIL